jgi:DNA-binding NtrC family response regulator
MEERGRNLPLDTPRILWITSAAENAESISSAWAIETALGGADGIYRLRHSFFNAVVIDVPVADWPVDELLEELTRAQAGVPILVRDAHASVADAVRYVRMGAHDVVCAQDHLASKLEEAAVMHRTRRSADETHEPWRKLLVGSSPAMLRTVEVIRLVGGRRSTVLITGETGTGKEMVARAVHLASPRAQSAMVAVNCNALPENLLEAELFGHVKGAFTGAYQQRVGRFEQAHRGTLFLDEIGDLPIDIQTKLLRVLQEREFQRLGSSETVRVDVRVIAATHVNLIERIREGRFREDLYYRLNVVPISTPARRERTEDIPELALHFVEKICRLEDIPLRRLPPETLACLSDYPWPGNVRQLENAVEMAVALSGIREVLRPCDFQLPTTMPRRIAASLDSPIAVPDSGLDFERTVGRIEKQILEQALLKAGGNKTIAAGMLGLKRTTLAAKLKSLEAVAAH